MSATVQSLDFACEIQSGSQYVVKATTTALVFGNNLRTYLCFEFHRISEYKYYYFMGTTISSTNNDNILARLEGTAITMDVVCNKPTPYDESTFIVLVKSGAVESGFAEATLPDGLNAQFSNVTIQNSAGSSTCADSIFDGCTHKSQLNFTYAACTSSMVFSSGGLFTALHYVTSGSYTFLSVWNNDTTVDGTSTYRFTCYVISSTSEITYATEYPNYCSDTSQTSTTVASPGIGLTFTSKTNTCSVQVVGQSYGLYYGLIILGIVTVLLAVIMIIVIKKKKLLRKCARKRRATSNNSFNNKVGSIDTLRSNGRVRTMDIAMMMQPMSKVELLYKSKRTLRTKIGSKTSLGSMTSINSAFNLKVT